MVRRHNNQLPDNLPQLQNLIKRDSASYHEEFMQQYQHFQNSIQAFQLTPGQASKTLEDLIMFMAQVSHCYPKELMTLPQQLIDLLEKNSTILNNNMRMTLCKALILLRNKNLLTPTDLLELFFKLLRCQDKALRSFLETHIITDIKNINAKHKNAKLNTTLQNFMFTMLKDSNSRAAKMSVDIMVELYKKNVWNDVKTVNVIATGCLSKFTKVAVGSLKFFLGKDVEKDPDSDSENEIDTKEVMMANKVNKKTRKREKQLHKVKKLVSKAYKKKSAVPSFNFSAIHLIHDPQGVVEKLFQQLESTNKKFEVKLITLDVISRLIGLHQLFLFSYYPYIQRFLQPHQREVTRILQFAAQASHELLPPDVIEPMLKTLSNNFITERNSSDVMAIGLNAVREICLRCPLAMNEDLLRDLAMYKTYKVRSVMMAAKSIIHLFRTIKPELLHKNDRGRPIQAIEELDSIHYGQIIAKDHVPGAEVLLNNDSEEVEINSDSDSNDEQWIDIQHSSDDENGFSESDSSSNEDHENTIKKEEKENENVNEENIESEEENIGEPKEKKQKSDIKCNEEHVHMKTSQSKTAKSSKKELAHQVTIDRILTDEDFKRIDAANVKKLIEYSRKGTKRKIEITKPSKSSEFVNLDDIENIYKKRKCDKQTRIESVKAGQADREKYGYKDGRMNIHCSKTNREKRKNKHYLMVKHKMQSKGKRSFKDKQIAFRNHLLKLKKIK